MIHRIVAYITALAVAVAVCVAAVPQSEAQEGVSTTPTQKVVTAAVERESLASHQAVTALEPLEEPCGLSQEDVDLIAAIIYLEAGGESAEGQQAVAEVIFNRLLSDSFPDTITEIIYQQGQFSSVALLDRADPGPEQYEALRNAIEGDRILPTSVVYFSQGGENDRVWGRIGGHVFCYE